ncbi:ABC transporter permease [Halococcus thailandensis]|uniref:ABC transporter permease n=1 Tax=Halococcus thailandensis JCM 13552 TaxID=1227457 RepID=M0N442_9EURY|nr:ABC transporter permease [Halococcus thailandensis]EMA51879.1 ABC transporter permease [Halococcus thailandensis JCM 13552]
MSTRTISERFGEGFSEFQRIPRRIRQAASIAGFLAVWWALVNFGILGFEFLSGPVETIALLATYLAGKPIASGGTIYLHAAYSTFRVIVGVGVATALAIPVGLAIGTSRWFRELTFPALELFRPIPPVAWVPISILLLPSVTVLSFQLSFAVVFVVFIGAFFPILINTIEGVDLVEAEYVRAAKSLGAGDRQVFREIILPATLPSILTGVSLGIGLGWITVVAAEIIAGNYGLGYSIYQAYRLLATDDVLVGMIAIGILGYASSALVTRLGGRAMAWNSDESS